MDSSDPRFLATGGIAAPPVRSIADPALGRPPASPPVGATRTDHQVTLRWLKGVAIVATAVAVSAFGGLVLGHPVGATTSSTPGPAGGQSGAGSNQGVTPVDPFFDPNPGGGSGANAAPAFGPGGGGSGFGQGGGGGGPAFQSGGS